MCRFIRSTLADWYHPAGRRRDRGIAQGHRRVYGQHANQRRTSFHDTQDTIYTLAADTGGKALLDSTT